jgi:hypothetical protein
MIANRNQTQLNCVLFWIQTIRFNPQWIVREQSTIAVENLTQCTFLSSYSHFHFVFILHHLAVAVQVVTRFSLDVDPFASAKQYQCFDRIVFQVFLIIDFL